LHVGSQGKFPFRGERKGPRLFKIHQFHLFISIQSDNLNVFLVFGSISKVVMGTSEK